MRTSRSGYAVAAAVLLLGMISLMAMSGYQLVEVLGSIRAAQEDRARARSGAEAGLTRIMGERTGPPWTLDSLYVDATTLVRIESRLVARLATQRSLYLMAATGIVGDDNPARQTIQRYALLDPPLEPVAALVVASGSVAVGGPGSVNGTDGASSSACTAVSPAIAGAMGVGYTYSSGGSIVGSPTTRTVASHGAALSLLNISWASLTGPDLPVDFQNTWPNFGSLPPDSFPVIRYSGDLTPPGGGRGFLIFQGTFRPPSSFTWQGVIVSGRMDPSLMASFTVRGFVVTGMDPRAGNLWLPPGADIRYDRCRVHQAFQPLGRLQHLKNTTWTPPY